MMPELSYGALADAMRLLEDEGPLREANELVVHFLHRHEVGKAWSKGTLASSDAMSLEASRYLWNARVDPRRRTYAMESREMPGVMPLSGAPRPQGPCP